MVGFRKKHFCQEKIITAQFNEFFSSKSHMSDKFHVWAGDYIYIRARFINKIRMNEDDLSAVQNMLLHTHLSFIS